MIGRQLARAVCSGQQIGPAGLFAAPLTCRSSRASRCRRGRPSWPGSTSIWCRQRLLGYCPVDRENPVARPGFPRPLGSAYHRPASLSGSYTPVISADEGAARSMEASKPPLPVDASPISDDSQESGLWLWRGEVLSPGLEPPVAVAPSVAPPCAAASPADMTGVVEISTPSAVRTPSCIERLRTLFISAARSAPWMAPASVWALIGLAAFVMAHLLPGGHSMPGNTSTAALLPVPAPGLARPISLPPPPPLTEAPLDQVQAPSAPVAQAMAEPTLHKAIKWRASHRSPLTVRRSHPLFAQRWTPVFVEHCRYRCDWAVPTE